MSIYEKGTLDYLIEQAMLPNIQTTGFFELAALRYFNHHLGEIIYLALGYALVFFLQKRKIFRVAITRMQFRNEIKQGLLVLASDVIVLFVLLQLGWLHFSKTTWLQDLGFFSVHFLFFEAWFYFVHRLQHRRLLFKFHGIHHRARVCSPISVLYQSLVDRQSYALGFLGGLVIISQLDCLSPTMLLLAAASNAIIGIMQHSNVEWLPRGKIFTFLHSSAAHALHHARIEGNYGYFTSFCDHLFASYIPDTELVAEQARKGQGLTRVSEKPARP